MRILTAHSSATQIHPYRSMPGTWRNQAALTAKQPPLDRQNHLRLNDLGEESMTHSAMQQRLACFLAAAAVLFAWTKAVDAADATQPATQGVATVTVPATIEAFEQADLYAKTSGYLA